MTPLSFRQPIDWLEVGLNSFSCAVWQWVYHGLGQQISDENKDFSRSLIIGLWVANTVGLTTIAATTLTWLIYWIKDLLRNALSSNVSAAQASESCTPSENRKFAGSRYLMFSQIENTSDVASEHSEPSTQQRVLTM